MDDSKVTDHHAIIPTGVAPKNVSLGPDEQKLFDLVCRRLLAAWHEDYIWSVTTVVTLVRNNELNAEDRFHSSGTAIQQEGWKALDIGGGRDSKRKKPSRDGEESDAEAGEEGQTLPPTLAIDQRQKVLSAEAVEKKTRPPKRFTEGHACAKCGKTDFRREQDILDVWWDSGVSWAAVAEKRGMGLPVDLYLEGSDQHRGWFHSSLLTSTAVRGAAPYRAVLTHGFVLDGQGKAMSKSLGNTIAPEEIIKKYGADILRLWVSASDYRDDVRISQEILNGLAEGYRKIRNTVRYMLGALDGFDPARDAVPVEELEPIDRWALSRLAAWDEKVKAAYRDYEFHVAYHATMQLCAVDLSAIYFDVIKDRLYTFRRDGKARRSAQTVLHALAQDVIRLLAPILSFTATEAWEHLPGRPVESVWLAGFPDRAAPADAAALEERYGKLLEVRAAVQGKLEEARRAKLIGSGLEATVTVRADGDQLRLLEDARAELATLFIVSKVILEKGPLSAEVTRASGVKCERCWIFQDDVGKDPKHPTICGKCADALA